MIKYMAAKVSVTAMVHCAKMVWLMRFRARMMSTSAGKAAAVCIAAIRSGRKKTCRICLRMVDRISSLVMPTFFMI